MLNQGKYAIFLSVLSTFCSISNINAASSDNGHDIQISHSIPSVGETFNPEEVRVSSGAGAGVNNHTRLSLSSTSSTSTEEITTCIGAGTKDIISAFDQAVNMYIKTFFPSLEGPTPAQEALERNKYVPINYITDSTKIMDQHKYIVVTQAELRTYLEAANTFF